MSQPRLVREPDWESILGSLREPLSPDESIVDRVMARLDDQKVAPAPVHARGFRAQSFRQRWVPAALGFSLLGILAMVLSWFFVLVSPGLTLAEVSQAVSRQRWAHLVFDDQMEIWVSMEDGRYLWKRQDGSCFHRDPVNRTEEWYSPALGQITIRKPEAWVLGVNRNGKIIPIEVDALQFPDIEQKAPESRKVDGENGFSIKMEYVIERQQDRSLGRFDEYRRDTLGEFHHTKTLWVDLKTKLPVRVRERMNGADRLKSGKVYRQGTYLFTETGPTTLAQLGVPVNTPIQKDLSETATLADLPTETQRALKGAAAAIERFPRHLRILELEGGSRTLHYWSASESYPANLAKEVLLSQMNADNGPNPFRYFSADNQGAGNEPDFVTDFTRDSELPVERIVKWFPFDLAVNTILVDGAKTYGLTSSLGKMGAQLQVLGSIVVATPTPFADQWEFATWNSNELRTGKSEGKAPAGQILVHSERADLKKDWYIDPQKDFAAVRTVEWRKVGNQWKEMSERRALGFKQLPGGQWYVSAWETSNRIGAEENQDHRRVEITVLKETDFPNGIFDGKRFLEKAIKNGAKVETD